MVWFVFSLKTAMSFWFVRVNLSLLFSQNIFTSHQDLLLDVEL
jgi:hypothetical protein